MESAPRQKLLIPQPEFEADKTMHKDNRHKLLKAFKEAHPTYAPNSVIFLKGDITHWVHDSDTGRMPDQEANFWYLFGVEDNDCYGCLEIESGKTVLFVPTFPKEMKYWMTIHDKDYFEKHFDLDEVHYVSEIEDYFKKVNPGAIYLFSGIDSDSKLPAIVPDFPYLSNYRVDKDTLFPILLECRVIKSQKEIDVMRIVGKVSSEMHVLCMQNVQPGIKEYQIEALYKFGSENKLGCRWMAYPCICGTGSNCAILHYLDNNKKCEDGTLALCDMGLKFYGYCSDVTTTYPINGKFTEKQKEIYNAVLEACEEVKKCLKPGVRYDDMHLFAERIILKHLIRLGIVKNVPFEELEEKRVGGIFFPHGLGHFLGLRVHDVGGYLPGHPPRIMKLGLMSLRTRREMKAGMCMTVEPGCYFIKVILDTAKAMPEVRDYLNWDKVEEYMEVGGVRIEDNIVITEDGIENFTHVPRTVEQIERCMAGLNWEN